jgi:hypothetical protein
VIISVGYMVKQLVLVRVKHIKGLCHEMDWIFLTCMGKSGISKAGDRLNIFQMLLFKKKIYVTRNWTEMEDFLVGFS